MTTKTKPGVIGRSTVVSGLRKRVSRLDPAVAFLFASAVGGVGYLLVTPPFQVPDEPAHFYRAYSLSQGIFNPQLEGGKPGAVLPTSLRRVVRLIVDGVPFHPDRRVERGAWSAACAVELKPDETELVRFPKSLQYSAFPYIPQAVGIALGRWCGASPLTLLLCGRLANLIVATGLIFLCVRLLPAYRWLAVLLALMPMAMALRSSVSADALTTAVAFLLTAIVTRIACAPSYVAGAGDITLVLGLSVALCLTKPVYLPLAMIILVIPPQRFGLRGRWMSSAAILALAFGVAVIALLIAMPSAGSFEYQIGPRLVELVIKPWKLPVAATIDYIVHGPRYGAQFIGELGWLDTPLPPGLVIIYALTLVAYMLLDSDSTIVLERWQRAVLGLVVVGSVFGLSAAVYVIAGRIEGLQGRYFHPIALVVVWLFHTGQRAAPGGRDWIRPSGMILATAVSLVVSWWTLLQRYYW